MVAPPLFSPQFSLRRRREPHRTGFSLVEMLIAMAILTIILGILFAMTQQTAKMYKSTGGQIEAFRSARNAFESMTRNLSLTTLNNYYDYVDAIGTTRAQAIAASTTSSFTPTTYGRVSDLHFVSGWYNASSALYSKQVTHSVFFQAPLGFTTTSTLNSLENLLNACGYYIEYRSDSNQPGFVSANPVYRYRLMEFIQPSESMTVYSTTDTSWFTSPLGATSPPPPVHQLASNIIALIVLPRSTSADAAASGASDPIKSVITNYQYNTRANTAAAIHNQLPPIVEVVMVAIDEASASKLPNTAAQPTVIQTALTTGNRFQTAASLDTDLSALLDSLTANHITYRVFRTLVPLRNSKWSTQ